MIQVNNKNAFNVADFWGHDGNFFVKHFIREQEQFCQRQRSDNIIDKNITQTEPLIKQFNKYIKLIIVKYTRYSAEGWCIIACTAS